MLGKIKASVPVDPPMNPAGVREVACLTDPAQHVEGGHVGNFTRDCRDMIDSTGAYLGIRERRFVTQALASFPRSDPSRPGSRVVIMSDRQWETWERLRGFHLMARRGARARAR